jgi:DinB superfamily
MPLPLDELVAHPELVNQRAQALAWEELFFEYELALDDIQAWLRGLSEEQIHFKPAEKIYSIAEIVTHNSFSDEMFWSWIALLVQGRGGEIDPNTLIGGAGARDTATLIDLAALSEACRTLARHTIDSLPPTPDLAALTPHPYFGALNAKGWIYFMVLHRGMHRYQCESVIDAPGFPRSASVQAQPREAYQPSERKTWLKEVEEKPAAKSKKKTTATARKKTAHKKTAGKETVGKKKTASKKKSARSK